jgi:amino acid transporter
VFIFRRRPEYKPPFRVPGYPVVPVIFIVATIMLLGNAIIDPSSRVATLGVIGVILLGIPVYFAKAAMQRAE